MPNSHVVGREVDFLPEVKYSKNENFLPAQTRRRHIISPGKRKKEVTGVAEGDNYVKRTNLPATFRSSWSGGPGQHAAP